MTASTPAQLGALGPDGPYRTRNRVQIPDFDGHPVAELSLAPKLYVSRAVSAMHKAETLPTEQRVDALLGAGRLFRSERIDGLDLAEYERTVSDTTGVPISVVREATAAVADAAEQAGFSAYQARPTGSVSGWRDPKTRAGNAIWTRRGNVFAVHAAGNHPGPHGLWLEALALGYRVAVRPSRREPFTPHRLVSALRAAGFPDDHVTLLPTDHNAADEILRCADLGMVYGGDDVVRKYTGSTILPQGPGRSKILVTADEDWRDHIDTIVDSVSNQGGVACINATAVLVDGDPAPLAGALAERLAAIPTLPPRDDKAILPVQPIDEARKLEKYLLERARGSTAWLGGDGIVDDLGNGSAALRPAVHELDRPDASQAGLELPFPCVWVAPWQPSDGVAPLRNTLVLTALTGNTGLVDSLVEEPTISNVYLDDNPTYWIEPGVPHDSYLGEFLMRTKTMIRD